MRKIIVNICICVFLSVLPTSAFAAPDTPVIAKGETLTERVKETFDLENKRTKFMEIDLRQGKAIQPQIKVSGTEVSLRELLGNVVDNIIWDNKTKTAFFEKNGKQLVITQSDKFSPGKNQVVLPKDWISFKNGKTLITFPFLAYIFDRYNVYDTETEEYEWKQKLQFLGISYIDNIDSSAKDKTLHSFIEFDSI